MVAYEQQYADVRLLTIHPLKEGEEAEVVKISSVGIYPLIVKYQVSSR
ncbi:MAG: hypothetical protein ACUBOA_01015 [Candidatus Loosdrechtia sp.]|nr:MAG: hypothetical protein QY305_05185 [Candidatus Jettenia sp. AMX2]